MYLASTTLSRAVRKPDSGPETNIILEEGCFMVQNELKIHDYSYYPCPDTEWSVRNCMVITFPVVLRIGGVIVWKMAYYYLIPM